MTDSAGRTQAWGDTSLLLAHQQSYSPSFCCRGCRAVLHMHCAGLRDLLSHRRLRQPGIGAHQALHCSQPPRFIVSTMAA